MDIDTRIVCLEASARRWRTAFFAMLAVAAISIAPSISGRAAVAADPAPRVASGSGATGQYQTVVSPRGSYPLIVLTDTHTGRTWITNPSNSEWEDKGVPPGAKAD